uniref:Uncharacterized protein n=1 Tax=Physcomitrium patens TaxID=3218 RepID=A0A2K1JHT1_PHYPA|nr:hypothetical protein PHYPA_018259 [Physcomitrium patens]
MMNPLEYDAPQASRPSSGHLPLTPSGSLYSHLFGSGNGLQGIQGSSPQSGGTAGMSISGISDFTPRANRMERGSVTAGLSSTSSSRMTSNSSSRNINGGGNMSSMSLLFYAQQQQ